ncbi:hypothetical protein NDU88_002670 [Pleurodeles waltl]|uniref:Uncharacterized protein n=1 Tax=Pleurodeles waltl TaxID=8319 RepID=A0AAV7MPK2_PLEWA|nr:hypothetical protein NDU88_002670 [Pleurodeles waltl]
MRKRCVENGTENLIGRERGSAPPRPCERGERTGEALSRAKQQEGEQQQPAGERREEACIPESRCRWVLPVPGAAAAFAGDLHPRALPQEIFLSRAKGGFCILPVTWRTHRFSKQDRSSGWLLDEREKDQKAEFPGFRGHVQEKRNRSHTVLSQELSCNLLMEIKYEIIK